MNARAPILLALTALVTSAGSLAAQRRIWDAETRVIVSDGGWLAGVAVTPRAVYAAAESGLLVFDLGRSRWDTPLPYPVELLATRPSALGWDPGGGTLWLGTENGDLFTTAPGFMQWDRIVFVPRGAVTAIIAAPREGAMYVRAGEWYRVRSGSLVVDEVPPGGVPPQVETAASGPPDFFFRAAAGTIGLDRYGRRWQLVEAEPGEMSGEWWIATDGGGLIHFDSRSGGPEWYRHGLAGRGAGSIAVINGALWFGGDGRGRRTGVARADRELRDWRQYDGTTGAPRGFVAEIVRFAGAIWFASADGLYRLEESQVTVARPEWQRLTSRDGLADDRTRCLLVAGSLLWAGTDRGLTAFDSIGRSVAGPLLMGRRVSRLALLADTLLVAAEDGLWQLAPGAPPEALTRVAAAPQRRAQDVIALDGVLWVIGEGEVFRGGERLPVRDPALQRIGEAYRLASGEGRLWVAGPRGIAHRDPVTGAWEAFTVPEDIPTGPVVDVLPDGENVWAATPTGAVRLRWR